MKRKAYIERVRRLIYNGMPSDDAVITIGMVNNILNDAVAVAAKSNYKDNLSIDGVSYVNNSFYTTFKGLAIVEDEQFTYKVTLPEIPIGIGNSDGISELIFKDYESRQLSQSVIWISESQKTYIQSMRSIPNKIVALSQGKFVYVYTTLLMSSYTANATMISAGLSTDLDGELNVPADYFPVMDSYIINKLMQSKSRGVDLANDGVDIPSGTQ